MSPISENLLIEAWVGEACGQNWEKHDGSYIKRVQHENSSHFMQYHEKIHRLLEERGFPKADIDPNLLWTVSEKAYEQTIVPIQKFYQWVQQKSSTAKPVSSCQTLETQEIEILAQEFLTLEAQKAINATKITLITLPEARLSGIDQQTDPFISLINQAKKEVLMVSFKLQANKLPQRDMLDALERAVSRDVTVHLIAENRLTDMEVIKASDDVNEGDSLKAYTNRGVQVYTVSEKFNQSHTKFIIVDGEEAMIGTTNLDKNPKGHADNQRPSRDFAVKLASLPIIQELTKAFWCDINGTEFQATHRNLLWGPDGQRKKLLGLIRKAEHSIKIYQQDITDREMIEALIQAAEKKLEVEVIMSPHPFGFNRPDNNTANQEALKKAGGKIFLNNKVNVHAKVMIIDDNIIYLGSTNFYQPAIDGNRNVGFLSEDRELIQGVIEVFQQDKSVALGDTLERNFSSTTG